MQSFRVSSPDPWIAEVFSAKAARTGGVIRRSTDWVAREIGEERFVHEVRRRGFHLLRAGNQYLIVCSADPVQVIF